MIHLPRRVLSARYHGCQHFPIYGLTVVQEDLEVGG